MSVHTVDFRVLHTGLQGHDGRRLVRLSGLEHQHGMADDRVFDHVHTRVFPIQSVQDARNVHTGRCTRRSRTIVALIDAGEQRTGMRAFADARHPIAGPERQRAL